MRSKLLSKFNINGVGEIKNRIVMAPMTRGFADKNHC